MHTIIVTGAGGQLGRQLMRRGAAAGLDIAGFGSAELDITDEAAAARLIEPGAVVINCAAYTAVDRAESDVANAEAVNVNGPRTLAIACARLGARLIHISTDYIFAGDSAAPYEMDADPAPRTVYGRTKLAGEHAVRDELPHAQIVRTAWVYAGERNDFVATMLRLESERDTIDVVDDQIGSPTFAGDLASGLLELATHPDTPRTLHLTNAGQASWFELAQAVFESVGADPQRVRACNSAQFARPAPRPAYSVLSNRAWIDAGLTPLRPWRAGLAAALAEHA